MTDRPTPGDRAAAIARAKAAAAERAGDGARPVPPIAAAGDPRPIAAATPRPRPTTSGPSAGRILAASAAVAAGVGIVGVIGAQAAPETGTTTADPAIAQLVTVPVAGSEAPTAPAVATTVPTRTVIIQIPASAITGGVAGEATTVITPAAAQNDAVPVVAEPAPRQPVAETKGS